MIEAGYPRVDYIFGYIIFCYFWQIIEQMPIIDKPDKGTIYSLTLRTLVAITDGIFQTNYVLHC